MREGLRRGTEIGGATRSWDYQVDLQPVKVGTNSAQGKRIKNSIEWHKPGPGCRGWLPAKPVFRRGRRKQHPGRVCPPA